MNLIELNNVSKSFRAYHDKCHTLIERVLFFSRHRYEFNHVLKNINLRIDAGKTVGIIGPNGSGKSTLLKVLNKIIYPDQGEVIIRGKLSGLLELGVGFHPDFSGRENIYYNASIYGLTRKQIDQRLQQIIDFSELGDSIDHYIRTYSWGMYMRLGFAIATNVNAEILLIDEVLAVGDVNFQKKCYEKIDSLRDSGITIILVTHETDVVKKICDRAIWIDHGVIQADGSPQQVVDSYLAHMNNIRIAASACCINL
jgi:ABC-type polysaccharide/polyol phosphate transport system ATPase subunit